MCRQPAVNSGKCREHYNEYMNTYRRERHRRVKTWAVEHLGGCCTQCGATRDLEFDHVDPLSKTLDVSVAFTRWSRQRLLDELAKCQLLCPSCHDAKTVEQGSWWGVEHGGGASGKRNCPCVPCKTRKSEYQRLWTARQPG